MSAPEQCEAVCLHCLVSRYLQERQNLVPITARDMCSLGQVIADVIASLPDASRGEFARFVKINVDRMIDEAANGEWRAP